jgi:hypothetical protein
MFSHTKNWPPTGHPPPHWEMFAAWYNGGHRIWRPNNVWNQWVFEKLFGHDAIKVNGHCTVYFHTINKIKTVVVQTMEVRATLEPKSFSVCFLKCRSVITTRQLRSVRCRNYWQRNVLYYKQNEIFESVTFIFNPLRPSGKYMNHLLWHSIMLHFVFISFERFSL